MGKRWPLGCRLDAGLAPVSFSPGLGGFDSDDP